MSWQRARSIQPEVTTILSDGTVYRETRFGTVQRRKPVPPLEMDAEMRACLAAFRGAAPKPAAPVFVDMEGDLL